MTESSIYQSNKRSSLFFKNMHYGSLIETGYLATVTGHNGRLKQPGTFYSTCRMQYYNEVYVTSQVKQSQLHDNDCQYTSICLFNVIVMNLPLVICHNEMCKKEGINCVGGNDWGKYVF